MINLKNEILIDLHYVDEIMDLKRIQKALFFHKDLFVTLDEAAIIWQNYSDHLAASWLFVPEKFTDIVLYIESDDQFQGWEKKEEFKLAELCRNEKCNMGKIIDTGQLCHLCDGKGFNVVGTIPTPNNLQ